jgi:hypothetical protein
MGKLSALTFKGRKRKLIQRSGKERDEFILHTQQYSRHMVYLYVVFSKFLFIIYKLKSMKYFKHGILVSSNLCDWGIPDTFRSILFKEAFGNLPYTTNKVSSFQLCPKTFQLLLLIRTCSFHEPLKFLMFFNS